jgi:hypothetical protein
MRERIDRDLGMEGVRDRDVDEVDVLTAGDRLPVGLRPAPAPTVDQLAGPLRRRVGDRRQDRPGLHLREGARH